MTPPRELMRKLQLKSGDRVWLINVPPTVAEELAAGAEVEIVGRSERCNAFLGYFNTPQEVATVLPEILAVLEPSGLFWTGFRKGAAGKEAGLTRDRGWDPLEDAGWTPVRSIALDDEWSALRWRRKQDVAC